MSHDTILAKNDTMINFFRNHRLPLYFPKPALRHIGKFITAATAKGYRGKVTDLAEWSSCHRTSLGYFLSNGVWDDSYIQRIVRQESLKFVHSLSEQTKQPIFVIHYALVDSWYTCPKLINTYATRGYHLIGALKTNRILYPKGLHTPLTTLASYVTEKDVRLVTVNGSSYWVYRCEGALNGIENAVVLFCWPENAFQKPKALHAFLCTGVSLETQTILNYYSKRWPIEIFFRQAKGNLGFNRYQVRSIEAIERLWALLAFTHLYCTIGLGEPSLFGDGLRNVRNAVKADYVRWIYECGQKSISLDVVSKRLKIA